MDFLIAGLLVLDLAVTVLGVLVLRRELAGMEKRAKTEAEAFLAVEADTAKSLSGLWKETSRQTAALEALLAREDAAETLKRLEERLEDAPGILDREQESALSKAMEEGITNLLQYSAGKGREAGT